MNQNNGSSLCGAGSRIPPFKGLPRMLGNPVGPPRKQKARANQKHKEKPNQYFEECRKICFIWSMSGTKWPFRKSSPGEFEFQDMDNARLNHKMMP